MSISPQASLPSVRWEYHGATGPLVGRGAPQAVRLLGYGGAARVTVLILWLSIRGGAAAQMPNPCTRVYHKPARPCEGMMLRVVRSGPPSTTLHIHPIRAAALLGGSAVNGLVWSMPLQLAVWLTLTTPLHRHRALATLLTVLAVVAASDLLPLSTGLEWFTPCRLGKRVVGHALREEPSALSRACDPFQEKANPMETLKTLTLTALIVQTSGCTDAGARYTPLVEGTRNAHFPGDLGMCQNLARAQSLRDRQIGSLFGTVEDDARIGEERINNTLENDAAAPGDGKQIVIACMRARGHAVIG